MGQDYAIQQLHTELTQIVENYQDSLRRTNGPLERSDNEDSIYIDELKNYNKFAIVIYSLALRFCEQLAEESKKI